ncbi:MAG TPA: glycosyltransferase [Longimicrobiales bacterium]|nr:glycosyltransferase [Longimicrobiales bacterium]
MAEQGGPSSWDAVLLEDLPAAEAWVGASLEHPRVHLRLHNVLVDAFAGMEARGSVLRRLAWRFEQRRIATWEGDLVARFGPSLTTLSPADADRVASLYGASSGVLPLAVPVDRYRDLGKGDPDTLVHVGTADERKGAGLADFVQRVWPEVRRRRPAASLLLGGRGTERFDDPVAGVSGLGFVPDDRVVLARGGIFVNPQKVGSGVKLKSLVALAAGRCLLSYAEGVRGVGGTHDADYSVATSVDDMIARAVELMERPAEANRIASLGLKLVSEQFSAQRVRRALPDVLRPDASVDP